jgi:phosphate transport system ATP-binding protein
MQIRDFDFYYDDFQALKNLNYDIIEKEVLAFIGPSG